MIIKWLLRRCRRTLYLEPILQESDSRYEDLRRSSVTLVKSFFFASSQFSPLEDEGLGQIKKFQILSISYYKFSMEVECNSTNVTISTILKYTTQCIYSVI